MAIDKDFVIRNGLQVNDDLIYADPITDNVGIGTTQADKKLVVIGDSEVSKNLTVGESLSAVNANLAGFVTATTGFDIGLDGGTLSADVSNKRIGINSTSPEYTVDIRGPVSTGTNAAYIFGDVEVTGSVTAANFTGQVQGGGDLTLNNLTVNRKLTGSDGEIYTLFVVNKPAGNDNYRFRDSSNPPAIGFPAVSDNPTIYLNRGQNYRFDVDASGSPFFIKTQPTTSGNEYNDGVVNNGVETGICTFKVPYNAPNVLYYQSSLLEDGGGKIVLNNDGSTQNSDNVTVSNILNSQKQANFVNINATGITTLESLKGPNNFSVSAGILTVRQDRTALIGVSTGSERIEVDTAGNARKFNITFVESPEEESDYKKLYVDTVDRSFAYNPNNNTLFVDKIETTGTISGVTTGSEKFRVDPSNQNIDYDIPFVDNTSSLFRRPFIDSIPSSFTFNPNKNNLSVTNITAVNVTAPNLSGVATGASKVAITSDTSFTNNNKARILLAADDNPDTSRFDNILITNTLRYNRGKGILFAGGFNGVGSTITNLNASNIDRGEVDATHLPNARTDAQGIVQLTDSVTTTDSTIAATATAVKTANDAAIANVPASRLPDASTDAQGIVQLNNTVTSASILNAATPKALKFAFDTAIGVIPNGTRMLFYQAAAPTGWTKDTTNNIDNTAIRVVSGTDGGNIVFNSGKGFTEVFKSSITVPLPAHNHEVTDNGHSHTYPKRFRIDTNTVGDGTSDNQILGDTSTDNLPTTDEAFTEIGIQTTGQANASLNFDVNYVNVIICTKDEYSTAVPE